MSGTREENVFMARLAEQAERYEDMIHYMKGVAAIGAELSLEERNLLSVAFKNAVGQRRQAWRQISSMMSKEEGGAPPCVKAYLGTVEAELNGKCNEILALLRDTLLPGSTSQEAQVFYKKMEGDYYRYLAEFAQGADQAAHAQNAFNTYTQAKQIADVALAATHPIRLGLALNFSVFYFEVYQRADEACKLARESFDAAMAAAGPSGAMEQDAAAILQLLRDNLTLWSQDQGDGRQPEQDGTYAEDL